MPFYYCANCVGQMQWLQRKYSIGYNLRSKGRGGRWLIGANFMMRWAFTNQNRLQSLFSRKMTSYKMQHFQFRNSQKNHTHSREKKMWRKKVNALNAMPMRTVHLFCIIDSMSLANERKTDQFLFKLLKWHFSPAAILESNILINSRLRWNAPSIASLLRAWLFASNLNVVYLQQIVDLWQLHSQIRFIQAKHRQLQFSRWHRNCKL